MAAKVNSLASIDPMCTECAGKCWNASNNKSTQEAAMKMFGIIPNHCVNSAENTPKCPYALGLIK